MFKFKSGAADTRMSRLTTILILTSLLFPSPKPLPPAEAITQFHHEHSQDLHNKESCDYPAAHIAMTVDASFLRGSVAAIHSILRHSHCPENVFFHFISHDANHEHLIKLIFPSLRFKTYYFNSEMVKSKISPSLRRGLEQPLNYARNYLARLLGPSVGRVIYLDSDVIVVDDILKLWKSDLNKKAVGSPEYCHANFTKYFTPKFWSRKKFWGVFDNRSRRPCYFNTGVMVIDLHKWRESKYTEEMEKWMEVQRQEKIYELGSLPPFLLVFAGNIQPVEQRWNQHGLGGDSVNGSCRELHPGPVSLMHWSGGGKPWLRLDSGYPCPLDLLWSEYDVLQGPPSLGTTPPSRRPTFIDS